MKYTRTTAIGTAFAAAFLTFANAAQADVILHYPGTHVFNAGGGQTITTGALNGTLTGIRVTFTYQHIAGSSRAYDVAFTVGAHQWGGYFPLINGAEIGETPTGAPSTADPITFNSTGLGMGYSELFNNRPIRVGFGNGNNGGACTISDVTITLMGVIPTPGAAAALSLSGLTLASRRRR